jgi:hypothetical protein
MLEILSDVPPGIDGLRAVGKLSKTDYERTFEPLLAEAARAGRRLRFLYELGPDFEGFTPSAAWEDVKVSFRFMRVFEACAVVTDLDWVRSAAGLAHVLLPCPVKAFRNQERTKAIEWLRSQPEGAAMSHRLTDRGVLVVRVDGPLRAQDFDALAVTADRWIDAHGWLRGLVIHAKEFPGWQNLAGLLQQVRFVRDHHRKIQRIALAVDGKLIALAPRVGNHFVHAEVRSFGYTALDAAIAWAGDASRSDAVHHA